MPRASTTPAAQRDLFALFGLQTPAPLDGGKLSVERAVTLAELVAARAGAGREVTPHDVTRDGAATGVASATSPTGMATMPASAIDVADAEPTPSLPPADMSVAQLPTGRRTGARRPVGDLVALRAQVKAGATDRPGTYRFLGEGGEVLYVGKSKQLRTRLLSYFRAAWPHDKGARILWRASRIEWHEEPSEFAALLRELRLIKALRPRYNAMMKRDARHYCFVRLTPGPAPRLVVVRSAAGDERGVLYGPYTGAARVAGAIRELSDLLGLRDCAADVPMHFTDQVELPLLDVPRTPRCLRHEIGRCLGPCVGATDAGTYAARLATARAFLDGTHDGPLADLEARMTAHADALEYERAAALRDKLGRLEGLRAQFARLRFAVESLTFAYPVAGEGGLADRVYLVRRGTVRAELPVPRTAAERDDWRARCTQVFGTPEPDVRTVRAHEVDELLLLSSWFSNRPEELERTVAPDHVLTQFDRIGP